MDVKCCVLGLGLNMVFLILVLQCLQNSNVKCWNSKVWPRSYKINEVENHSGWAIYEIKRNIYREKRHFLRPKNFLCHKLRHLNRLDEAIKSAKFFDSISLFYVDHKNANRSMDWHCKLLYGVYRNNNVFFSILMPFFPRCSSRIFSKFKVKIIAKHHKYLSMLFFLLIKLEYTFTWTFLSRLFNWKGIDCSLY